MKLHPRLPQNASPTPPSDPPAAVRRIDISIAWFAVFSRSRLRAPGKCAEMRLAEAVPFRHAEGVILNFDWLYESGKMRGVAYVIAAVAALGIMFVIATAPGPQSGSVESDSAAEPVAASSQVMTEAGTLTLSVPEMHCEFACFPKVKETLEGAEAVEAVNLAAQKEEGVLDNRQVIVKYQPGFDLNAAIASLEAAGYTDTKLVP